MRVHTKETQASLTPRMALEILQEGNARFVKNYKAQRDLLAQVNATRDGQWPFATILSCIDSRTSSELVFDQGLGDVFSIRIAGNIVNTDILGSMEFACEVAGSKLIVVLGHTRCGAVQGACNHVEMGHLTGLLAKIGPAVHHVVQSGGGGLPPDEFVERVALENTRHQMRAILARSPILEHLYHQGRIGIVGGLYSVETGEVQFFEEQFLHRPAGASLPAAG